MDSGPIYFVSLYTVMTGGCSNDKMCYIKTITLHGHACVRACVRVLILIKLQNSVELVWPCEVMVLRNPTKELNID